MRKKGVLKVKIINKPFGSEVLLVDEDGTEYELSRVVSVEVNAKAGELPTANLKVYVDHAEAEIEFLYNNKVKGILSKLKKIKSLK